MPSAAEPGLRSRALACLARREHSRRELERKLAPHAQNIEELQNLLDDLQKRGWLSEKRVVEQVVHVRRAKFGAARIAHELREKGVAEELIEEALPRLRESELEAARAVWQKKFGDLPQNARERARQMRFLQSRGFGAEVIREVLRQEEGRS